ETRLASAQESRASKGKKAIAIRPMPAHIEGSRKARPNVGRRTAGLKLVTSPIRFMVCATQMSPAAPVSTTSPTKKTTRTVQSPRFAYEFRSQVQHRHK